MLNLDLFGPALEAVSCLHPKERSLEHAGSHAHVAEYATAAHGDVSALRGDVIPTRPYLSLRIVLRNPACNGKDGLRSLDSHCRFHIRN